jgi:uncharacterized protein (TIGR02117 family)
VERLTMMRGYTVANALLQGLALVAALLVAGCASPAATDPHATTTPPAATAATSVQLVSHGWHTGIAIGRADLPDDFPALADFPRAAYLEFGWGDADYYTAAEPTLRQGMRALFRATPSVLHLAAIDGEPAAAFPASTVIRLPVSANGLRRLIDFIGAEFARDAQGGAIAVGPGQYGDSRFYRATGTFRLPRTCNRWAAEALAAAGLPVDPARVLTAGALLAQAARHGEVLQRR